jgi:predicted metal-dependent enzyme (double-stranded beta helix superfamily)
MIELELIFEGHSENMRRVAMAFKGLYTLDEFGQDVSTTLDIWGDSVNAVLNMGQLVQRFIAENDHDSLWTTGDPAAISSGLPGRKLYDDADRRFRLLLAEYAPNTATAVHSHEGWVVIGIIKGSERYTSWRRADDGSDPAHADLEIVQDHHIMEGEFGYLYNQPFNVHRQSAEGQGALELVLMKGRGQRLNHIDVETGDCSEPVELNR